MLGDTYGFAVHREFLFRVKLCQPLSGCYKKEREDDITFRKASLTALFFASRCSFKKLSMCFRQGSPRRSRPRRRERRGPWKAARMVGEGEESPPVLVRQSR